MRMFEVKEVYRRLLKELDLTPKEVVLMSGSALLLYGLRDQTMDLDVNIPESKFNQLKESGKYKSEFFGDVEYLIFNEHVDLHIQDFPESEVVEIDGVGVGSLEEMLRFKERLVSNPERNPKKLAVDYRDIESLKRMIQSFLNFQSEVGVNQMYEFSPVEALRVLSNKKFIEKAGIKPEAIRQLMGSLYYLFTADRRMTLDEWINGHLYDVIASSPYPKEISREIFVRLSQKETEGQSLTELLLDNAMRCQDGRYDLGIADELKSMSPFDQRATFLDITIEAFLVYNDNEARDIENKVTPDQLADMVMGVWDEVGRSIFTNPLKFDVSDMFRDLWKNLKDSSTLALAIASDTGEKKSLAGHIPMLVKSYSLEFMTSEQVPTRTHRELFSTDGSIVSERAREMFKALQP